MGLFNFGKKKKKKESQQNMQEQSNIPGGPFLVHLLMREKCEMPPKEQMCEIMQKHLGDVECILYEDASAGFDAKKYKAELKDGTMSPPFLIMGCSDMDTSEIDAATRNQMWDCPERDEILEACQYHVVGIDHLGGVLNYKARAEMLMDYLEALVEIFPTCEAVFFQTSGKLLLKDKILNHKVHRDYRFIRLAVNIRGFNINDTEELIVDTLGMSTLNLPDVQYHFHGMDQNTVVFHAWNVLAYIFDNECPIKDGETIDGLLNGEMSHEVKWRCRHEKSIIPPERQVVDVYMDEFAAGKR